MLTSRMSSSFGTTSECGGISTRRSLKKQLSFQVSFASAREMESAIDCLNKDAFEGKDVVVCKVEEDGNDSLHVQEISDDDVQTISSPVKFSVQMPEDKKLNEDKSVKRVESSPEPMLKSESGESLQQVLDPVTKFQQEHFWRNFFLMTGIQVLILFDYVLLTYLTNLFEQVYLTGLLSYSSEIGSCFASGPMFEKLGVRKTYMISLGIATLGGILIITYGLDN